MSIKKTSLRILLTIASVTLVAGQAQAAVTYTWLGGTSNDWNTAANWDVNGVPVDYDTGSAGLEFAAGSGNRIVINATTFSPTTNVPALYALNGTSKTPTIDVLNGTASFNVSTNLSQKGFLAESGYSATIGDGNASNGLASLTYTVNSNVNRGISMTMLVNSDGALFFNSAATLAYDTSGSMFVTLAGGSVTFNNMTDILRGDLGYGDNYFDFTAAGATFTSDIGGDFADLTAINALIGDSLFFRSTTALTLGAQDNGNGTFSVTVIPEPSSAGLIGLLGALLLLRRRR